jgi:hypothetical protein
MLHTHLDQPTRKGNGVFRNKLFKGYEKGGLYGNATGDCSTTAVQLVYRVTKQIMLQA